MSNTTTRKTLKDVEDFLLEIGSKSKLISKEYINNSTKLEFLCDCNKSFKRCFSNIQQRKTCQCRECGTKNGWKEIRRKEGFMEDIHKTLFEFDFTPVNTLEYVTKKEKISVINKDGYLGDISIENIKKGIMFSVFSIKVNKKNLIYNLNNYCKINNFKTKIKLYIDENVRSTCDLKILCECECGNEYITSVGDLTTQNRAFCRECTKSQSINEKIIKTELDIYDINYEEQKRFNDCRSDISNYKLPFDFYLIEQNTIIEVDGEQHFKPTRIKGISEEDANIEFDRTRYNDIIKNNYCINNNINIIRISYKQIKDKKYKEIIQSIIK